MTSGAVPQGTRQLFVYWKVAAGDREAVLVALGIAQRELRQALPWLHAQGYVRVGGDRQVTLMETYSCAASASPTGLSDDDIALIEGTMASSMRSWCNGQRHCEVFDALPP